VIADWRDAEEFAVWHMKILGFASAAATSDGADAGVDVLADAERSAAQVKHLSKPVGRPDLQRFYGATRYEKHRVFYSTANYTRSAIEYGQEVDMALFTLDIYGNVEPQTDAGEELLEHAGCAGITHSSGGGQITTDWPTTLATRLGYIEDLNPRQRNDLTLFILRSGLDILLAAADSATAIGRQRYDAALVRHDAGAQLYAWGEGELKKLTREILASFAGESMADGRWWCRKIESWIARITHIKQIYDVCVSSDKWDEFEVLRHEVRAIPLPAPREMFVWWVARQPLVSIDVGLLRSFIVEQAAAPRGPLTRPENYSTNSPLPLPAEGAGVWGSFGEFWNACFEDWEKYSLLREFLYADPLGLNRDETLACIEETQGSSAYLEGRFAAPLVDGLFSFDEDDDHRDANRPIPLGLLADRRLPLRLGVLPESTSG